MLIVPKNNFFPIDCINEIINSISDDYETSIASYTLLLGSFSIILSFPIMNFDDPSRILDDFLITPPNRIILDLEHNPVELLIGALYRSKFFNVDATYLLLGKRIPCNLQRILTEYFISKIIYIDYDREELSSVCLHNETLKLVKPNQELDKMQSLTFCTYGQYRNSRRAKEEDLFQIIWDKVNITLQKKLLKEKKDENCDIFSSRPETLTRNLYDVTVPYIYDKMFWYSSKRFIPIGFYPLRMYNETLWLSWLVTLLILSLFGCIIENVFYTRSYKTVFAQKLSALCCLFLEQPMSIQILYTAELIIALVSVYAVFNMTAIYKTKLFFYLTQVRYDKTMKSLEHMKKQNVEIWLPMSEISSDLLQTIKYNVGEDYEFRDCGTTTRCWNFMYENRKKLMALLLSDLKTKSLIRRDTHGIRGRWWRKHLPPFLSVRVAAFCKKGHPFLPIFNNYLRYMMEYGFSDFMYQASAKALTAKPMKLTLNHLMAPLIFWLMGISVGALIFFLENFWCFFSKK